MVAGSGVLIIFMDDLFCGKSETSQSGQSSEGYVRTHPLGTSKHRGNRREVPGMGMCAGEILEHRQN